MRHDCHYNPHGAKLLILQRLRQNPKSGFSIIPVWGSARVNPKPGKSTTLQRKSILGALKVEIDFNFFSGLTKHVENVFFAKKKASHLVKSCLGNTIYNLHPNMSFPFYAIFTTQISKKYSIVLCEYDWHS